MRSLNLDLLNETRLTKVEPVEIMVRGSLDLGIHVVLSIEFGEKDFLNKKRVIKLSYSREQLYLHESRKKRALEDYIKAMTMYGATPPVDKQLASKIKAYNDHLDATYGTLPKLEQVYMTIFNLGRETSPYISPGEWHTFFSRYTNDIYGGPDQIFVVLHVLTLLVKLFKNESMGEKGLQYLVAWSVYRQLVEFTDPYMFLRGKLASDACYNHVRKVMNLAVITPFFQSEILGYMVGAIKKMVSTIRSTYQKAFESSTWIGRSIREAAIRKLNNITSYVGSPGNRLDSKYVEEVYIASFRQRSWRWTSAVLSLGRRVHTVVTLPGRMRLQGRAEAIPNLTMEKKEKKNKFCLWPRA
ncbi:uncharacterized protein LOC142803344 isoform X1 [Rhipicephalus microplus]|uniref:uncharacterized protein LOC142803344 isoform X1 n=2 Tax=Rhipicephalus microplus TaxID=6941 RepID=UPI003F6D7171